MSERGAGPERYFTGGVGYLYRILRYEGAYRDDERTGYGAVVYTNGDSLRGTLERGRFYGVCVYRYGSGWEKGGIWKDNNRERWLTEEEERERVAKEASEAGAGDGVGFGHGSASQPLQLMGIGNRRPSTSNGTGQTQLSPLPPRPPGTLALTAGT